MPQREVWHPDRRDGRLRVLLQYWTQGLVLAAATAAALGRRAGGMSRAKLRCGGLNHGNQDRSKRQDRLGDPGRRRVIAYGLLPVIDRGGDMG